MSPNSEPPPLEAWIKQAQNGDQQAFSDLFDHCYDIMYRYALKWSGNATDAEDITQLSSIKMAKNIGQYRFDAAFTTWLYRLVVNTAIDWQRQYSRHQTAEELAPELEQENDTGDSAGFNWVLLQQLTNRIAAMGEGFREAVVLVLGEGCSHKEAADILAIKESTVSWRIHQVRKLLTESLGGCND